MEDKADNDNTGDSPELSGPAVETPPETKRLPKMVNVYNSHRYKSFYLRHGHKIGPHTSGRIPLAMFNKLKDTVPWLQRAERGDVVK